jgi:hypothetical protein
VIEAKDAWDVIEQPGLEAKASVTGDGTIKGKVKELKDAIKVKANRVMDVKARTIIMGYCKQEALFKILHLWTAKEQ